MKLQRAILIAFLAIIMLPVSGQEWISSILINDGDSINITDVAVDDSKNVYIFGNYENFLNIGDSSFTSAGKEDIFLAKYDSNYTFQWAHSFGGIQADISFQCEYNSLNQSIYVIGEHKTFLQVTPDPADTIEHWALKDGFVAMFNADGSFTKGVGFGGIGAQRVYALDVKGTTVAIGGQFAGQLNIGTDVFTSEVSTNGNAFYAIFDNNLNYQFATNIPSSNNIPKILDVTIGSDGIFYSGNYAESVYTPIDTITAITSTDIMFFKTNFSGDIQFIRGIGGNGIDEGLSLEIDDYNVYLAGYFKSTYLLSDSIKDIKSVDTIFNSAAGDEMYVISYSQEGVYKWGSCYHANSSNVAFDIAEQNGFLNVCGHFAGEMQIGSDILTTNDGTDQNACVFKIDTLGNEIGAVKVAGNGSNKDSFRKIDIDQDGFSNIAGFFQSSAVALDDSLYNNPNGIDNYPSFSARLCPIIGIDTVDLQDVTCAGAKDGLLEVKITGGINDYSIMWNNGAETEAIVDLFGGTYTATVTYADGRCRKMKSFVVFEPTEIKLDSLIVEDVTNCEPTNGKILVYAKGGLGDLKFSIDDGITYQVDSSFADLKAGIYNITIQDTAGCLKSGITDTLELKAVSMSLDTAITVDLDCNGADNGELHIGALGGNGVFHYSIDGGSNYQRDSTFMDLEPTEYIVALKDSISNCEVIVKTVSISEPDSIIITDTIYESALCYNQNSGSIVVDAAGGTGSLNYTLLNLTDSLKNNASGVFSALRPDSYLIKVKDANDCGPVYTDTIILSEPSAIIANSSAINTSAAGASDGSISISTSGGTTPYSFSLNAGATQTDTAFTGLSAGSYTVTVDDANNCGPINLIQITISDPQGINESMANINLFPNPTNGVTTIQSDVIIHTIEILDLSGKTAFKKTCSSFQEEIDFSNVNEGLYIIKINNIEYKQKLVVN